MGDLDLTAFDALTFDTYGTLIDWEAGLLAALRPVLDAHGVAGADAGGPSDDWLLERYGDHEAGLEAGEYLPYREVLGSALSGVCAELGFAPEEEEIDRFGGSVADWPAFPDSAKALADLAAHYRLGVITNCDDDLFAHSARRLGEPFTWIITAQQARAYKPSSDGFELAFRTIDVPRERILHVAQSLFHDHVTTKRLGMRSVWIDRRRAREGSGATPPVEAEPDLTFPDMAAFAAAADAAFAG